MAETMQGRRIAWEDGLCTPGDYAKAPVGVWHAITPNGHGANLSAHQVEEHEDGTITVTPSIEVFWPGRGDTPRHTFYHGHLTRGVWAACEEVARA